MRNIIPFCLDRCTHITKTFFIWLAKFFLLGRYFTPLGLRLNYIYFCLFVCFVSANAPQGKILGGIMLGFTHSLNLIYLEAA